jgi:amino-acid N-acetyltransferase
MLNSIMHKQLKLYVATTMLSLLLRGAFVCGWTSSPFAAFRSTQRVSPAQRTGRSPFRRNSNQFTRVFASNASNNETASTLNAENSGSLASAINGEEDNRLEPSELQSQKSKVNVSTNVISNDTSSVLDINPEDIEIVKKKYSHSEDSNTVSSAVSDMFRTAHFVDMFRGSANYIASHRNTLIICHIPGDWIDNDDPSIFRNLMNDIALTWLLGLRIVLVVGCRYQLEKRLKDRVKHMNMVVTDAESLRVVKEEAGYVRFEVERQLARSLQGSRGRESDGNVVSGNFYSAQPFGVLDGVDYQYSGFVRRFEADKINQVHKNRDIVLLTTLGVSPTGEVFNVNSEYLAAYAGGALGASKVVYFLEHDVELRHKVYGNVIPHLRVHDSRNLLNLNGIKTKKKGFVFVDNNCPYEHEETSMLVKIGWSMHALENGVKRVHILTPDKGALLQELYTRDGAGTMISGDLYDGIRQAQVTDVTPIHELISPLIEIGTLVDRPKAALESDIHQYHVYTRDDLVVATGQLKLFEEGYAEIACLVVSPVYRAKGRGDAMLGYLERLCLQKGANKVFVLSTQTMEWFIERGFDRVGVETLPPSRQATYNKSRASKIYMKKIDSVRDLDASELLWNR